MVFYVRRSDIRQRNKTYFIFSEVSFREFQNHVQYFGSSSSANSISPSAKRMLNANAANIFPLISI